MQREWSRPRPSAVGRQHGYFSLGTSPYVPGWQHVSSGREARPGWQVRRLRGPILWFPCCNFDFSQIRTGPLLQVDCWLPAVGYNGDIPLP
ncbi:hypothetical protein GGTG_13812 [Gaeumannomyces tritici R3-111a-1]|uniref:Uncharacterized protein n=1 Tax=Gaeumannomyces tritici (strain R3-111a-1) TaxID=644352 RepID=J3PJX1_GAET3|nr:hypothetical protein GGTG_13812 [Gaeumannomyces tritici R3-111a-1]EJT68611.1 hypothetical protein GGTG_13812 [Gaeumannomyces tritici R3-111a-1]